MHQVLRQLSKKKGLLHLADPMSYSIKLPFDPTSPSYEEISLQVQPIPPLGRYIDTGGFYPLAMHCAKMDVK